MPIEVSPRAAGPAPRPGDRLLLGLLCIYLASLLVEGPLRYALYLWQFPNLLYLRDAIPVASIAVLFARRLLVDGAIELAIAVPCALLVLHGCVAALNGVAFFSIAFGQKIFLLVAWGIAMAPLVQARLDGAIRLATAMFWLTVAGVAAGVVAGRLPWEAVEYQTAFGNVTTTRLWWIPGGTPRVPGLMRTSFDAAMALGITGFLAMLGPRRARTCVVLALLAFSAIAATTSKGMLVAFPLAAGWALASRRARPGLGAGLVLVVAGTTFLLPFLVAGLPGSMVSVPLPDLIFSVRERFTQMWPEALALLPEHGLALLGAGIGSIGAPQLHGHAPHAANAADSLAIYMAVTFGVPGAAYYVAPAFALARRPDTQPGPQVLRACTGILLITYAYGISLNMIEGAFFAIVLGVCTGMLMFRTQEPAPDVRSPAVPWQLGLR